MMMEQVPKSLLFLKIIVLKESISRDVIWMGERDGGTVMQWNCAGLMNLDMS